MSSNAPKDQRPASVTMMRVAMAILMAVAIALASVVLDASFNETRPVNAEFTSDAGFDLAEIGAPATDAATGPQR